MITHHIFSSSVLVLAFMSATNHVLGRDMIDCDLFIYLTDLAVTGLFAMIKYLCVFFSGLGFV